MKKSDFIGWREVYSFTFSQTVKQKAYGIFLVIFSVIALFSSTVTTLVKQYGERKESKAAINEVVIFDETGLGIEYSDVFTSKKYKNVSVMSNSSKSIDEYESQMDEDEKTMLIEVTFDKEEENYHILFIQSKAVSLAEIAKVEFADEFCDFFEVARMKAANISEEQRGLIETDIVTEVKSLSETGDIIDKKKDSISFNDYFITIMMIVVCMMLVNISGNQIALSIVTEKSSRVLEYLILNVRPLALIVGKLIATIVTSLLQMIAVGFCYIASPIVSNMITPKLLKLLFGVVESAETNATVEDEVLAASVKMIHGIKIEYIIFALLFMVLGIVFYGIIAGLLGAATSKMDELQESMTVFQLMLILGCYADMALCVIQISGNANPILNNVVSICPITSPFIVPCNMILGKMSMPLIVVSILVIFIAIVLLFMLTANVYEAMIFYNGKVLKMKDVIALASSKNKSVAKEEVKNEE